jgi:hypothetical protein
MTMIRWNDFTRSLALVDCEALINALTVGWGYADLAKRTAGRDGEANVLARYVEAALVHLDRARRLLGPAEVLPPPAERAPLAGRLPSVRWRDGLTAADAEHVRRALADGAAAARDAAEVARADGFILRAHTCLDQAIGALSAAHDRLANRA